MPDPITTFIQEIDSEIAYSEGLTREGREYWETHLRELLAAEYARGAACRQIVAAIRSRDA